MSRPPDFGRSARLLMLVDQGLYTGTNFLLGISLAAFVGMEALGHFALIISVSALLHSLHTGVILEPMTVFGSSAREERLREIYGHSAAVISALAIALAAVLYAGGGAFGMPYMIDVSLGFAIFSGQSAVLCCKRQLLIPGKVRQSLTVSVRYFAGAGIAAAYSFYTGSFDEHAVVLALIIGSFVSAGLWWVRSLVNRCSIEELRGVISAVRKYTTWTFVTSLPASAALYGIYWIAEFTSSRETVGLLKLCEQLITPFLQIAMTMSMLDQIESAREFEDADTSRVADRLAKRTSAYSILAAVYVAFLLLAVAAYQWFGFGSVENFLPVLALYCAIPFLYAYSIPRNVAAKACRRPEINAYAYFGMALTIVATGALLMPSRLIELVGLLLLGWIVNAVILRVKVTEMLGRMKRAF